MGIWLDQQSGQKLGLTVEKTVDSRSAGPVIFFCATIASLRHGLPFCDATWWSHHSGGTEVQQREQQTLVEQMNRWYGKGSYIHNIYIYIHFTYIYIYMFFNYYTAGPSCWKEKRMPWLMIATYSWTTAAWSFWSTCQRNLLVLAFYLVKAISLWTLESLILCCAPAVSVDLRWTQNLHFKSAS